MLRGFRQRFKMYEEHRLHTKNTDILAGKLKLKDSYVILITALLTHYSHSRSQDRDFLFDSKDSPALLLPKPNRGLIAASVSLHNLTAIRRFHSVGVKQQGYRPNRNTIRHVNYCGQNRTQLEPAVLQALTKLIEMSSVALLFKLLLSE